MAHVKLFAEKVTVMEIKFFDRQTKGIILCFIVYSFLSIYVFWLTSDFIHAMIVWNLFLAILPLIFAKLLKKVSKQPQKARKIILSLLWLLFFPNSPYMITDFIHISGIDYYVEQDKNAVFLYSTNIVVWIKIVHIGVGVFWGTLTGLLSLYIIHRLLAEKKNEIFAGCAVAAICLLSGYAIYMGRFLRLNTWDILRPTLLLARLASNMNLFSLNFSYLFAVYIFAAYSVFYVFYNNKR